MKYSQAYPNSMPLGVGLISAITAKETAPWHTDDAEQVSTLERLYSLRSSFKTLSEGFQSVPEENRADVILALYGDRWKRLFDDYKVEYNPLNAYTMTETTERNVNTTDDSTTTFDSVTSDVTLDKGTVTDEYTDNTLDGGSVYGFNSNEPVPADKNLSENHGTSTETRNLTDTRNLTRDDDGTKHDIGSEKENFTSTKSGNIGYTTPQELLRQDFELWATTYFQLVFDDIDSLVTLSVYD